MNSQPRGDRLFPGLAQVPLACPLSRRPGAWGFIRPLRQPGGQEAAPVPGTDTFDGDSKIPGGTPKND